MAQVPIAVPTPNFPSAADLVDLQGDIVLGIPKRFEDFTFFNITNATTFKQRLQTLIPSISTTADVQAMLKEIADHKAKKLPGLVKLVGINIAFTFQGLQKLGVTDSVDPSFEAGQLAHAQALGDQGTTDANGNFTPNWLPAFKSEIDGVVLVAGDSTQSVEEGDNKVNLVLGDSIKQVLKVNGNVRPGKEKGHEHFGFLDGISFPCIPTLNGPALPGQLVVQPGVLVCGQTGDPDLATRPAWTKNGSILMYRQLNQLVPEFNKFLADNPLDFPGIPRDQGSELLGARFFGRWKSGAPVDLSPTKDDPTLAANPQMNNNFDFSKVTDQTNCPFAAHIRKTNPRTDLPAGAVPPHGIMRQGIPFGPELTEQEQATSKTELVRGLAFICYQTDLATKGFEFLQEKWANTVNFPPKQVNGAAFLPGFDPIIGQNGNNTRTMAGTDPKAQGNNLTLPFDFVVSKGGAYFFSPSISALKTKIAA